MAAAVQSSIGVGYLDGSGAVCFPLVITYVGADVPGGFVNVTIPVSTSGVTSNPQYEAAMVTAIRNYAAQNTSFTVPANLVFLITYTAS